VNGWDQNIVGLILFAGFFLLYGLEFFIPLVPRKSKHLFSNIAFALILLFVNLLFTSLTLLVGDWVAQNHYGLFNFMHVDQWLMLIISIPLLDLYLGYFIHFLFHRFSWLWSFHSIHHSDDLVDVTTTFRQHPIESVIRICFHLTSIFILGIPVWVLLVYLTMSTIIAQVEHANIRIPNKLDRWLQYVVVTPYMHKVHHSRFQHETDSNYSNIFSFWDRMFGTYKRRNNYSTIQYGLDYLDTHTHYSLLDLIKLPFKKPNNRNLSGKTKAK
jgi:sterol desaturase/sphingolipid hydroxylase (fatty acid hydroxylase superfamily)